MDRIAVISDVHGNLPAFEAVLADIRGRGIVRIMCLGDLAGKGPSSAEAVDLTRASCEIVIRGNWDQGLAADAAAVGPLSPATAWHCARLGPERLAYLRNLPNSSDFVMSGNAVRLYHASQRSVDHRVHRRRTELYAAMFENTDFTGFGAPPSVVGYGDIHDAFLAYPDGKTLFNAGSVGNPLDLSSASYVILEGRYGDVAPGPLGIQIVRVPYDIERAVADAEASGMPFLAAWQQELRTGEYVARGGQLAWP